MLGLPPPGSCLKASEYFGAFASMGFKWARNCRLPVPCHFRFLPQKMTVLVVCTEAVQTGAEIALEWTSHKPSCFHAVPPRPQGSTSAIFTLHRFMSSLLLLQGKLCRYKCWGAEGRELTLKRRWEGLLKMGDEVTENEFRLWAVVWVLFLPLFI